MSAVWIETPGAAIRLRSERLEVRLPAPEEGSEEPAPVGIPLAEIDHLVVAEDARLSFPAFCEVLRRGIPVLLHDWRGAVLGSVLPPPAPMLPCASSSTSALKTPGSPRTSPAPSYRQRFATSVG